jgi:hypothetical protein
MIASGANKVEEYGKKKRKKKKGKTPLFTYPSHKRLFENTFKPFNIYGGVNVNNNTNN